MPDEKLVCKDCGDQFVFSEREQEFYASQTDRITKKPWEPPKRCVKCRAAKKARNAAKNAERGGA